MQKVMDGICRMGLRTLDFYFSVMDWGSSDDMTKKIIKVTVEYRLGVRYCGGTFVALR